MSQFLAQSGINMEGHLNDENYSMQYYMLHGNQHHPLRCDYHLLRNKGGKVAARMFTLSDLLPSHDLLTEFYTWNYFHQHITPVLNRNGADITVVMCDINGLTDMNETLGVDAGDRAIQYLARTMQRSFPEALYFVRGREAILYCVLQTKDETSAYPCLNMLQQEIEKLPAEKQFQIQYAVHSGIHEHDVNMLVEATYRIIRTKKLLDCSAKHSDILNSLIQVLQECDKDTEAHVHRTQRMAEELGRRLGLNDDEQSKLALLAILHDIGKVGIPLDILNKPGKLTADEWTVIKGHVDKGARIASSSVELNVISDLILYHHERWDGKGYPSGLSKESIPLLSRIIAVVDSYDAMVYNRSYRNALGDEYARQELRRNAGTQFDPGIVSIFLQMLEEGDRIAGASGVSTAGKNSGTAANANENHMAGLHDDALWSAGNITHSVERLHVHAMSYGRYVVDLDWNILQIDENFTKLTGYT